MGVPIYPQTLPGNGFAIIFSEREKIVNPPGVLSPGESSIDPVKSRCLVCHPQPCKAKHRTLTRRQHQPSHMVVTIRYLALGPLSQSLFLVPPPVRNHENVDICEMIK